jgi:hypothetical protein
MVTKPSPFADRCTATAKSTGLRCERRVIGGGVCIMHGGNAPQVRNRREARILAAEAAQEMPVTATDAAAVMTSAMSDAHSLLQRLKVNMAKGQLESQDLTALGDWIDRAARVAKLVNDAGLEERKVQLAEDQARILASVIRLVLAEMLEGVLRVLADDQLSVAKIEDLWPAAVGEIVPRQLRAVSSEVVR